MKQKIQIILILIMVVKVCKKKERIYIFHSPEGGRAAKAFQGLFSHTDGKIRNGYGRKVVGTERLILTDPTFALSVI
jgi:hypothetical protein